MTDRTNKKEISEISLASFHKLLMHNNQVRKVDRCTAARKLKTSKIGPIPSNYCSKTLLTKVPPTEHLSNRIPGIQRSQSIRTRLGTVSSQKMKASRKSTRWKQRRLKSMKSTKYRRIAPMRRLWQGRRSGRSRGI